MIGYVLLTNKSNSDPTNTGASWDGVRRASKLLEDDGLRGTGPQISGDRYQETRGEGALRHGRRAVGVAGDLPPLVRASD